VAVSGASLSARPTIALVRDLCAALEADGVRYCHWKSNAFLDRSRTGDNDLDLLIDRADADRFAALTQRLGFKLTIDPARGLPGVLSYYGFDGDAERLVHVHAHFQLIVGDDLTKNYRIPLERAFLESARRDGELRVPSPELELMLLAIRLVLKHCTWDAIATRRGPVPGSARAELAFLRERADPAVLRATTAAWLPTFEQGVLDDCLAALRPGASRLRGVRAGRRLVPALHACARRSRRADVGLKAWRRATGIGRRAVARPAPRKRLAAGGAMIAIVGADGAGKSTAVEGLAAWLGRSFAVTRVHLGRPPRSRTTRLLRIALLAPFVPARLLRGRPASDADASWARSRQRAILAVALARDRYLVFVGARRIATNGGLVICDRFPVPQLQLMDAPRVERLLPGAGMLARLERRYYRAMRADLLIVLRVDPEIAVARKPDEPADFVRTRWREIWDVDWSAVPAQVIDASQPADVVLAQLKTLIWARL
jgi:thymidylate kinase